MPQVDLETGELYHYGVKGMKWGVRRARDWANDGKVKRETAKRDNFEKRFQNAGDKRMSNLSNEQIKEKIERLQNEKKLKDLMNGDDRSYVRSGKKETSKLLLQNGRQVANMMTSKAMQDALRKKGMI